MPSEPLKCHCHCRVYTLVRMLWYYAVGASSSRAATAQWKLRNKILVRMVTSDTTQLHKPQTLYQNIAVVILGKMISKPAVASETANSNPR